MIENFRDGQLGSLAQFHRNKKRSKDILVTIESALARKLDIIEYATTERSLFAPPSNHYERLSGSLAGWSSIRVNIQWRLIFRWRDDAAHDVYLDPHKY
ncbi:type II toxin-antitoxin system RelE/ParE family toxin [Yersinia massiliensis]|uniref:Toxin n=1 Tax=Yersinia massiliensis TaxID=419257 RepID=A0ABM6UYN9_9GAMM|nr:type II toxin-antitoxin system RelE/ParE family toxin [Yersinia massiliensis]AVX39918.1 toxin [Yersinia massiliensis]QKJ10646.1 type II toxin-antitoxin system RelE/ParE family toxin [Yersinia massiliensis]